MNNPAQIQAREREQKERHSVKTGVVCEAAICVQEVYLLFARTPDHGHCHASGILRRQIRLSLPHDERPLVGGSILVCCLMKDHESA